MRKQILKLLLCLSAAAALAYSVIEKENSLTTLRRELPRLQKEQRKLQEENRRLRYEIDSFESPLHLMELAGKPEFGHLRYPYADEVIIIEEEAR